jgi:hypothetical protein
VDLLWLQRNMKHSSAIFLTKETKSLNYLTDSLQWILPEKNRYSASQEIPLAPHYFMESEGSLTHAKQPSTCTHPESDQSTPNAPSYFTKICFNGIVGSMAGSSKWNVCLQFSTYIPTTHFIFKSMHATFPAHTIVLDLIALKISGEQYKSWSSSLWNCLRPRVTGVVDAVMNLRVPIS